MHRFAWVAAIGASVGLLSAAGCGSSSNGSGFGDDASTGDDATASDGGSGDDGFSLGDVHLGDGSTCATHCSSDLHSVLDCNDNVVQTCPSNQGCGMGGCVAPCDSAKANKSTFGCDYFSVDPDIIVDGLGACFAAFLANTWNAPITITADWGGQTLNVANFARIPSGSGQSLTYQPLMNGNTLLPGQVAVLFFNRFGGSGGGIFNFNCPAGVTPAVTASDGAVHGTTIGKAFHFTTSAPVVAYDMFPFGGGQSAATSATLLLPTTAWDTNYIAVNAFRKSAIVPSAQNFIEIVAAEDATTVTISPTAAIVGGSGVAATGAGQPKAYTLNKGQYLQITQDAELSGSPIQSDKPVGLWGGATCLNIDVSDQACDSAHQQIPPVKALGHEYAVVRYRSRIDGTEETTFYRMVGAVDGTTLTYEPSTPAGAPTTLRLGQVAEFRVAAPFVVKSQDDKHPFYVSGHMTGGQNAMDRGDPEFVNIIPPQEYLSSYVFFTDPTYPETNLVLVRSKTTSGFKDVKLDCMSAPLTGWLPVGSSGQYEYTRTDLVRHNFAPQNGCDNGRHEIHSDGPFGLTVWGWGSSETTGFLSTYVSYAYPAGASVQPINTVVVPPTPR